MLPPDGIGPYYSGGRPPGDDKNGGSDIAALVVLAGVLAVALFVLARTFGVL